MGSKRLHNEDVKLNGKNEIVAVVQSAANNEVSQQIVKELNTVHDENLKCNNGIYNKIISIKLNMLIKTLDSFLINISRSKFCLLLSLIFFLN